MHHLYSKQVVCTVNISLCFSNFKPSFVYTYILHDPAKNTPSMYFLFLFDNIQLEIQVPLPWIPGLPTNSSSTLPWNLIWRSLNVDLYQHYPGKLYPNPCAVERFSKWGPDFGSQNSTSALIKTGVKVPAVALAQHRGCMRGLCPPQKSSWNFF